MLSPPAGVAEGLISDPTPGGAVTRALHTSIRISKPIADTWFGEDEPRRQRTVSELFSKVLHMNPQYLRAVGRMLAPDVTDDLTVSEDPAGVPHQGHEQLVLERRQTHRLPIQNYAPAGRVMD